MTNEELDHLEALALVERLGESMVRNHVWSVSHRAGGFLYRVTRELDTNSPRPRSLGAVARDDSR